MPPTDPGRPVVVWLRDDLRTLDNPALAAAADGRPVIPVYLRDTPAGGRPLGAAARWWLAGSLEALAARLASLGSPLVCRAGPPELAIPALAAEVGAAAVHWNRRYDAEAMRTDAAVAAELAARGVAVEDFQANLLFEPWSVRTGAGAPFRVFTPFWRAARAGAAPRLPLAAPTRLVAPAVAPESEDPARWGLRPTAPDWAAGLRAAWTPGEAGAEARLAGFLDAALADYAEGRDRPAAPATSLLSPHLRFGEISPFRVFHAIVARAAGDPRRAASAEKFLSEIGWREFSWHLLHQAPDLASRNLNPRFNRMPWRAEGEAEAWRRGRTGIPIVDAGMRALWRTGFLHNRVRMIVASFLTKHLLVDWRVGEAWFWDTLVDADAASNPASWQWVAGSGADAAPYFRIFNPVLQGERFDPAGAYVRAHLPALADLDDRFVHRPWEAPPSVLAAAGVRLGETYPHPIVDLRAGRARALAAFGRLADAA